MAKLPSWKQIANQKDVEVGYLLLRCLKAEGKDPDDTKAIVALLREMEEHTQAQYSTRTDTLP